MIIYDEQTGHIYLNATGIPTPSTLAVIHTQEIEGKYVDHIDVTKKPHEPVYKDYPKSEMQILKESSEQQQADIDYLMLLNDAL